MANVKIELNQAGVRELLRSNEAAEMVKEYAEKAMRSLGPGYELTTRTGKYRVNAEVAAVTHKAKKDNLENNTILKAIGV